MGLFFVYCTYAIVREIIPDPANKQKTRVAVTKKVVLGTHKGVFIPKSNAQQATNPNAFPLRNVLRTIYLAQ